MFYSKSTSGFYDEATHGSRLISVIDPAFEYPLIDVVLQPTEVLVINGEVFAKNTTLEPITIKNVPNMEVVPDYITVPNPECKIPDDAVEITYAEHADLLAAESQGKVIVWDDGTKKPVAKDYVPTAEDLAAQAKAQKLTALNSIKVTTSTGKVFDGNETARLNMLSAITAAGVVGQTSANWKLADNTVENVTLDELKEALALSIKRVGEIVTG